MIQPSAKSQLGEELFDKIVSLAKRRGFIFQSSELYGGINGFWDYGPVGVELKNNIKAAWWNEMVRMRDDVVGLDATIIMSPQVWKASGHVDTFIDMMVEDPVTNKRYRVDQIEPQAGIVHTYSGAVPLQILEQWYELVLNGGRGEMLGLLREAGINGVSREEGINRVINDLLTGEGRIADMIRADVVAFAASGCETARKKFSVLVPIGKPPESARKIAQMYYGKYLKGEVVLIGPEIREKIENSVRFSPDSGAELTEPRPFNLMFITYVGPVQDSTSLTYLRPETAQAIFVQFKNILECSRQKVPFGIAQIGKAFRNEVTPRNFTFRSREFEQMELEFFIKPDEAVEAIAGRVASPEEIDMDDPSPDTRAWGWEAWHRYWVYKRLQFYERIGLPASKLVVYWQKPEELAHYARACVDILFKFPFGKRDANGEFVGEELEGIAARSDFDLSQHQRFSGKPLTVFDEELRKAWQNLPHPKQQELRRRYYEYRLNVLVKAGEAREGAEKMALEDAEAFTKGYYIPHVIEPSAGVDRIALALLCSAYDEDMAPDEKGNLEKRVVLRFHPRVAPIKVAVMPLLKNRPEQVQVALRIRDMLRPYMNVVYDDAGSIGRRYRRQDEIGTPFVITVDFETLGDKGPELKDTVTIRDRDTMQQERVKIQDLVHYLLERVR